MIATLRGEVKLIEIDSIVLEVNNIGYLLNLSINDIANLNINDLVFFYVEMIVKEDLLELYGFTNKLDKKVFNRLRSVSGVGTKTAISFLNKLSAREIISLILDENKEFLTQVPGIGKKTAGKIILELKDKFKKEFNEIELVTSSAKADIVIDNAKKKELVSVLEELGYKKQEIKPVLSMLDFNNSIEELIRQALVEMGR